MTTELKSAVAHETTWLDIPQLLQRMLNEASAVVERDMVADGGPTTSNRTRLRPARAKGSAVGRFDSAAPPPIQFRLTPRQTEAVRLFLLGASEKEGAAKLDMSRHTFHEHIKAVYRALGVSSRGELMAKFLRAALSD